MAGLFLTYLILTKEVSIQQGVDYEVHTVRMPLYVKIMDFLTRHNHYTLLVQKIIKGKKTDKEKLIALFEWTNKNILPIPEGFPIVDDHVDNIIIRGYGTDDQSADVFTTLAVYAGYKAGIYLTKNLEKYVHAVSLVETEHRVLLFDTYANFYFTKDDGEIVSLDEIMKDVGIVKKTASNYKLIGKYEYVRFFENLKPIDHIGWTKADLQVPSKRVIYTVGRFLKMIGPSTVFMGESYRN